MGNGKMSKLKESGDQNSKSSIQNKTKILKSNIIIKHKIVFQ